MIQGELLMEAGTTANASRALLGHVVINVRLNILVFRIVIHATVFIREEHIIKAAIQQPVSAIVKRMLKDFNARHVQLDSITYPVTAITITITMKHVL